MVRCTIKEVIRGKVASFVEKKKRRKNAPFFRASKSEKEGCAKQKVGGCYALETSNDTDRDVSL